MISLTTFYNTHNGKYVEVQDPTNFAQCFDLAVAWTDSLGIPRVWPYLYAYQIYTNFGSVQAQYYERLENTPIAIPQEGDIIVWSSRYNGGPGHVGVCTKYADINVLNVFEQNDPVNSPAHVKQYSYNFILGWLRPKTQVPNADPQIKLALDAATTSNNAIVVAKQTNDPNYQTKMQPVKAKLLEALSNI